MPEIELPADGEKPYGNKLRTAINAINDAVDAATEAIADGSAVTDSGVNSILDNPVSQSSITLSNKFASSGQGLKADAAAPANTVYDRATSDARFAPLKRGVSFFKRIQGIFLGDSHTAGNQGVSNVIYGYPRQSIEHVGQYWISRNTAVYAGVNGDRSSDMLSRLPALLAANPNAGLLSIAAGANDGTYGVSVETYMSNIDAMVQLARARGMKVILNGVPPKDTYDAAITRLRESYNVALAAYCLENNIEFVDIWPVLVDPATFTLKSALVNSADGHIKDLGHYQWALLWAKAFHRSIGSKPSPPAGQGTQFNLIAKPWMEGSGSLPTGWTQVTASDAGTGTVTTSIVDDSWSLLPQPGYLSSIPNNRWFQVDIDNTSGSSITHREYEVQVNILANTSTDIHALTAQFLVEDTTGGWVDSMMAHDNRAQFDFRFRAANATVSSADRDAPGNPIGQGPTQFSLGPMWLLFTPGSRVNATARIFLDCPAGKRVKFRIGVPGVVNLQQSLYAGNDLRAVADLY